MRNREGCQAGSLLLGFHQNPQLSVQDTGQDRALETRALGGLGQQAKPRGGISAGASNEST